MPGFVFFDKELIDNNPLELDVFFTAADVSFTDIKSETWFEFEGDLTFQDVAVSVGLFPSRTQAGKNGWSGLVPPGWTERRLPPRKGLWVCILKGSPDLNKRFRIDYVKELEDLRTGALSGQ